ncbi:MAG: GNAT family N-acetyltransferase [bacterium]|nr:GNAT family N-acetyltransferase [bacterium]
MGTARINVRRAKPDDLDFVVQIMLVAAKSHLTTSVYEILFDLDSSQLADLYRRVANSEALHWCHLSKFWIAEVDEEPAGAMCGYDPSTEGNDALSGAILPLLLEAGKSTQDLQEVVARSAIMDSCFPKEFPGAWGVENVAVVPRFRGQRITDHLFEEALSEGRHNGREFAQIMCLNGNRRAEAAWRRAGFELKADYTSRPFLQLYGCPGLKLLVRAL